MFFISIFSVRFSTGKCLSCFFNLVSVLKRVAEQRKAGFNCTSPLLLPLEVTTSIVLGAAVKQSVLVWAILLDFTFTAHHTVLAQRSRTLINVSPLPKLALIFSLCTDEKWTPVTLLHFVFNHHSLANF